MPVELRPGAVMSSTRPQNMIRHGMEVTSIHEGLLDRNLLSEEFLSP